MATGWLTVTAHGKLIYIYIYIIVTVIVVAQSCDFQYSTFNGGSNHAYEVWSLYKPGWKQLQMKVHSRKYNSEVLCSGTAGCCFWAEPAAKLITISQHLAKAISQLATSLADVGPSLACSSYPPISVNPIKKIADVRNPDGHELVYLFMSK
jgi:hypothetical protein